MFVIFLVPFRQFSTGALHLLSGGCSFFNTVYILVHNGSSCFFALICLHIVDSCGSLRVAFLSIWVPSWHTGRSWNTPGIPPGIYIYINILCMLTIMDSASKEPHKQRGDAFKGPCIKLTCRCSIGYRGCFG